MAMITISIGYSRELSNLTKIYTKNAKYSSRNDSFIFKLAIFHDIYSRANTPSEAKMKVFPTMLKGQALANNSLNINISRTDMNFNQIRYLIQSKWINWDKILDKMLKTRIGVEWRDLHQFLGASIIYSL